jgi:putative aldouronate transport system permease protein
MRPRKMRAARSKQLYAMMALPLAYFILFNYVPLAGNVPAFRRYRPGLGPFGTEWVGLCYFVKGMLVGSIKG